MYDDNEQAEAMKKAGAVGFISKSSSAMSYCSPSGKMAAVRKPFLN